MHGCRRGDVHPRRVRHTRPYGPLAAKPVDFVLSGPCYFDLDDLPAWFCESECITSMSSSMDVQRFVIDTNEDISLHTRTRIAHCKPLMVTPLDCTPPGQHSWPAQSLQVHVPILHFLIVVNYTFVFALACVCTLASLVQSLRLCDDETADLFLDGLLKAAGCFFALEFCRNYNERYTNHTHTNLSLNGNVEDCFACCIGNLLSVSSVLCSHSQGTHQSIDLFFIVVWCNISFVSRYVANICLSRFTVMTQLYHEHCWF